MRTFRPRPDPYKSDRCHSILTKLRSTVHVMNRPAARQGSRPHPGPPPRRRACRALDLHRRTRPSAVLYRRQADEALAASSEPRPPSKHLQRPPAHPKHQRRGDGVEGDPGTARDRSSTFLRPDPTEALSGSPTAPESARKSKRNHPPPSFLDTSRVDHPTPPQRVLSTENQHERWPHTSA